MLNPLLAMAAAVCLAAAPVQQPDHAAIQDELVKYSYAELGWGDTWEMVQQTLTITDDDVQQLITEPADGVSRIRAVVQNQTIFEKPATIGLLFDTADGAADTPVLYGVIIQYQQENEADIKNALTARYGDPKPSYTDKNGVENPLEFPGWVSPTTMEQALTAQQLAALREEYNDMEQTRFDAIVRQPLVAIMLNEEANQISFRGPGAAYYLAIQNK